MIGGFTDILGVWRLARTVLIVLCLGAGSSAAAARTESEADASYARFATIAGEAQDSVRFFRIYHWQALGERSLVLWLGREEPYLIDLRERCRDLDRELFLRIADYQRPGRNVLRARWSSIFTRDGQDCRIGSIRALDFSRIDEIEPRQIDEPEGHPAAALSGQRQWATLVSVHMEPPEYPKNAAGRNKHGVVLVAAEVMPDGQVQKTEIIDSSGHVDLDHEALRAVGHWRFEPYRAAKPGTQVWVQVPLVFSPDPGR